MYCTRGIYLFSLILLLVPLYIKCEIFQWHHLFVHDKDDSYDGLCFDNRNCAAGKHCVDNECRCIGTEQDFHVGKTCYKERNSGDKCNLHIQCPLFERCVNGSCQCAEEYVNTLWDGCQPKAHLDDLCFADEQCMTPHTSCIDNRCKCSAGYDESIHNTCEPEYTTVKVYMVSQDGLETEPEDDDVHRVARELGQSHADKESLQTKEIIYKNPHLKTEKKMRRRRATSSLSDRLSSILGNINIPGVSSGKVTTRPVPKLDQRCDRTSECFTVKNSICRHKSCKCKSSYVKKPGNNRQCFEERPVGGACGFRQQCPNNAYCKSNICQCNANTVKISPILCAPVKKLADYCKYSQQCRANHINTICSHGCCKCKYKYVEYERDCLPEINYLEQCEQTSQCPRNQECRTVCRCKQNHIYIHNVGCLPEVVIGGTCLYSQQCEAATENSICNSLSKCDCKPGYINYGNLCIPSSGLGEQCENSDQCAEANTICNENKICQCKTSFHNCSNSCWPEKQIGQDCECSAQCNTATSQCILGKCTCPASYVQCASSCEPRKSIGEDCSCDNQCTLENSICYNGKKCWCRDGYQHSNGQCRQKNLGKSCTTSEECSSSDLYSECQGNTCTCSATYTKNAKQRCEAKSVPVGGGCTSVEECQRNDRYSTCGKDGQCQCLPSFTNVQGSCTRKVSSVGDSCTSCIECVRGNSRSECSEAGKCVCSEFAGSELDSQNPSNCLPKDCGATHNSVSSLITIKSPSLSDGYYWNNADCLWTFSTSLTAFKIEIVSFATETMDYPNICLLDYATISNNNGCSINLCGDYDAGTTIYVSGAYVEIYFSSNEKFRKKGFELQVTAVDVSTIPSNCNSPIRNKDIVSWMDEQCCPDPAEDLNFETNVLRNLIPHWYSR